MPLDFPNSPTNGQIFTGAGGSTWTWDGSKWGPGGGTGGVVVSDTAPSSPTSGELWWSSAPGDGQMYLWYSDPNSSQWVVANHIGGGPYLPLIGGTLTGPLTLSGNAASALQAVPLQQLTSTTAGYLPLSGGTLTGAVWHSGANIYFGNQTPPAGIQAGEQLIDLNPSGNGPFVCGFTAAQLGANLYAASGGSMHYLSAAAATLIQAVPSGINFYTAPTGAANATASLSAMAQILPPGHLVLTGNYLTFQGSATGGVNTTGGPFIFGDAASIVLHLGSANTQFIFQSYSGTNVVRLDNAGNIGIGVPGTAGGIYFDTNATATVSSIQGNASVVNLKPGTSGTNQAIVCYSASGSTVAIFGTGGVCSNASGTWSTFSDQRLKRDVGAYTRGLDALKQLEPVYFHYNELFGGAADPDAWHYGFVAQQVEPIMPELCGESIIHRPLDADPAQYGDPDATYMTVDPTRSIFAVINALKELDARLEALEGAR
jgi:hypothetical protein